MTEIIPEKKLIEDSDVTQNPDPLRETLNLDGACEVCGGRIARLTEQSTEIETILVHGVCGCGAEPIVRGYFTTDGFFTLFDTHCPVCREELSVHAHGDGHPPHHRDDVESMVTIRDSHTVEVSGWVLEREIKKLVNHHTSYTPEETIRVCPSCHAKIHHNDDFRNDLLPDMTRREWESHKQEQKYHA